MSDDKKVSVGLNVRNIPAVAGDGYTSSTAADGTVYSYQYTGGDDGNGNADNGNVVVKQGKKTKITVTVSNTGATDPGYKIGGVFVKGDPDDDITPTFNGTTAELVDSATDEEDNIYYKITVTDKTAKTYFDCDPKIQNVKDN